MFSLRFLPTHMCRYSSDLSQELAWHCPVLSLVSLFFTTICDMINKDSIVYLIVLSCPPSQKPLVHSWQQVSESELLSGLRTNPSSQSQVGSSDDPFLKYHLCPKGQPVLTSQKHLPLWVYGQCLGMRRRQRRERQPRENTTTEQYVLNLNLEIFSLPKLSLILSPLEVWSLRAHSIVACLITQ